MHGEQKQRKRERSNETGRIKLLLIFLFFFLLLQATICHIYFIFTFLFSSVGAVLKCKSQWVHTISTLGSCQVGRYYLKSALARCLAITLKWCGPISGWPVLCSAELLEKLKQYSWLRFQTPQLFFVLKFIQSCLCDARYWK